MLSLAAIKLGNMAGGALFAGGAMGMGVPQTSFMTGFNRGMKPMPNGEHEGWEDNPSMFQRTRYALNRSGNAMLGNVGNSIYKNRGGLAMIAGAGLEYANQSFSAESNSGVAGKTLLGAGAGAAMGFSVGGPWGAAVGAAIGGLTSFTSALDEASKHALTFGIGKAAGAWGISMKQTGNALSSTTMQHLEELYTETNKGMTNARDVGATHGYINSLWHPGNTVEDSRNALRNENTSTVTTDLKNKGTEAVMASKDAIVNATSNIQDFAKYGNGFGQKVLTLGRMIDADFERNIATAYANKAKNITQPEIQQHKAESDKEYAKKMEEQAKELHNLFSSIHHTTTTDTAYGMGQINIAQQQATFAGAA